MRTSMQRPLPAASDTTYIHSIRLTADLSLSLTISNGHRSRPHTLENHPQKIHQSQSSELNPPTAPITSPRGRASTRSPSAATGRPILPGQASLEQQPSAVVHLRHRTTPAASGVACSSNGAHPRVRGSRAAYSNPPLFVCSGDAGRLASLPRSWLMSGHNRSDISVLQ